MDTLDLVDAHVRERVLLFGSLPPGGRDLDLLVRRAEEESLNRALASEGFRRRGRQWVRFRACTADVIDLTPAQQWDLPQAEEEALFREATPLDGSKRVSRPSPHHALLILARRVAANPAVLDDRRRARVEEAIAASDGAMEKARRRASLWQVEPGLDHLETAWRDPVPVSRKVRARIRRPRRGAVVSFSGLDGSGKSTQAAALRDTLDRLGYDAVVHWSSVSHHGRLLKYLVGAVRWFLRRGRRDRGSESRVEDPAKALRQRSTLVGFSWTLLVALVNGCRQTANVYRHLWLGRVVICDRYLLDSKAHLRYAYGPGRSYALHLALIRLLSPHPDLSFFLDVSAETATTRKADYELPENTRLAQLYREESVALGARRIDGARPQEEICAQVANEVWDVLAAKG